MLWRCSRTPRACAIALCSQLDVTRMLDRWILTHRRVGDLQQMRTLASALEARAVEKASYVDAIALNSVVELPALFL